MIKLILCLLISCNANAFLYEEQDKNLHLSASMAGTFVLTSTIMLTNPKVSSKEAALIAAGSVILIGLAKETLVDDKFDANDMLANSLGAGLGTIPFIIIDF